MSVSAQLFGLVSTRVCAILPLVPPDTGATDRASGYAVIRLKRSVIGCGGYLAATGADASVPSSWPMPLTSTTTLLPTSIAQSLSSARGSVIAARVRLRPADRA